LIPDVLLCVASRSIIFTLLTLLRLAWHALIEQWIQKRFGPSGVLILFGVHLLEDKNAMRDIPEQFETVELGLGKDIVAWRHFYVYPPDLLSPQDVVEVKKALSWDGPTPQCLQPLMEEVKRMVSGFNTRTGRYTARDTFDSLINRYHVDLRTEHFAVGSPLQHASHVKFCLYTRDFNLREEDVIWRIVLRRNLRVNNEITDLAYAEWIIERRTKIPSVEESFEEPSVAGSEHESLANDGEPLNPTRKTSIATTTVSSENGSLLGEFPAASYETARESRLAMHSESLRITLPEELFDAQDLEQNRLEAKKALKQVENPTRSLISSQFSSVSRGSSCSSLGDGE
jgi:hypothetical protein